MQNVRRTKSYQLEPQCGVARLPIGLVKRKMILVNVDSHSKWIEAHVVTSQATIEKLWLAFYTHGLLRSLCPMMVPFHKRRVCCIHPQQWHQVVESVPHHPASNELAKRTVQTLKNALKKDPGGVSLANQISRSLSHYRIIPLRISHLLSFS